MKEKKQNQKQELLNLTAKQQRFVEEYLVDLNASQAALRAGYSKKTAFRSGQENMQKPAVKAALAELMQIRSEKTNIDAEWVLKEAAKAYEINAKTYFDEDGKELMINANAARAFLEQVGKHIDIQAFKEQKEIILNDKREDLMIAARKRIEESCHLH